MLRFVLRRLLLVIPSLAGLLVLTFFLIRVVPADPAAALAGENASPAQIAEIRRQYGTALHLLSYAAYASGKFDEARGRAQEAVTFEWEGMEVAFFDLSRAAAEMGQETEALTHGERAFRMARGRAEGASLQPFAQNYVNILRQFGQEGLAARVLSENATLGVH